MPSDQCGRLLPPRKASPTDEAFMAAQISMYDQMAIKMLFAQKGFTAVGISADKGTRRDGGSTGRCKCHGLLGQRRTSRSKRSGRSWVDQ